MILIVIRKLFLKAYLQIEKLITAHCKPKRLESKNIKIRSKKYIDCII